MTRYHYSVAGFSFSVCIPEKEDMNQLLPSFRPFLCGDMPEGENLFHFSAPVCDVSSFTMEGEMLEDVTNDMGRLRLYRMPMGYGVSLLLGNVMHYLLADKDFSSVRAFVRWDDVHAGNVLSSLIRIAYSQSVLRKGAVSLHAAAVSCGGKAYLFMGKSGTGKSTHAALWMKYIPGCELLNDDNPTIRMVGNMAMAYGTPWSGKTPCYKQCAFPVGGMVRLRQAPENRFRLCSGSDAFVAIYPGCSVISQDVALRNSLYDTLARLAEVTVVGTLACRPDEEAARLCFHGITEAQN